MIYHIAPNGIHHVPRGGWGAGTWATDRRGRSLPFLNWRKKNAFQISWKDLQRDVYSGALIGEAQCSHASLLAACEEMLEKPLACAGLLAVAPLAPASSLTPVPAYSPTHRIKIHSAGVLHHSARCGLPARGISLQGRLRGACCQFRKFSLSL